MKLYFIVSLAVCDVTSNMPVPARSGVDVYMYFSNGCYAVNQLVTPITHNNFLTIPVRDHASSIVILSLRGLPNNSSTSWRT